MFFRMLIGRISLLATSREILFLLLLTRFLLGFLILLARFSSSCYFSRDSLMTLLTRSLDSARDLVRCLMRESREKLWDMSTSVSMYIPRMSMYIPRISQNDIPGISMYIPRISTYIPRISTYIHVYPTYIPKRYPRDIHVYPTYIHIYTMYIPKLYPWDIPKVYVRYIPGTAISIYLVYNYGISMVYTWYISCLLGSLRY